MSDLFDDGSAPKLILCNWCGKRHVQPAQSALEALARCCKVPTDAPDIRLSPSAGIDRSEVSRALAKAIAYKECGKDREAAEWARQLVRLLACAEILR